MGAFFFFVILWYSSWLPSEGTGKEHPSEKPQSYCYPISEGTFHYLYHILVIKAVTECRPHPGGGVTQQHDHQDMGTVGNHLWGCWLHRSLGITFLLPVGGRLSVSPNRKPGGGVSQPVFSCCTWKGLSVINVQTHLMSLPTELWLPVVLLLPREGRAYVPGISGLNLECTFLEKKKNYYSQCDS